MTTIYATEPMIIGKHEWRGVVRQHADRRSTSYEWRTRPCAFTGHQDAWQDYRNWPRYDFNDGTYAGCPRTLRKLYEKHKAAISAAYSDS